MARELVSTIVVTLLIVSLAACSRSLTAADLASPTESPAASTVEASSPSSLSTTPQPSASALVAVRGPGPAVAPNGTPVPSPVPSAMWEAAPTPPPALPIDPTIAPISASAPSADARAALSACGAFDVGFASVRGAGLIARTFDATKYVAVPGTAPQIAGQANDPAWVIQFKGEWLSARTGESWIDHTCIYVAGIAVNYATGPRRDLHTGQVVRGYYLTAQAQTMSLPRLAP